VLLAADCLRPRRPFDLVALSSRYLGGRQSSARLRLLAWARAKALGESIRVLCAERGWARRTFYRDRARGLAVIAEGLNRDRVPPEGLVS
jgi:hypothetical protein